METSLVQDLQIYMTTHKRVPVPTDPYFIPLQCGAALHEPLEFTRDDTGDNISDRNPHYSEMTGLYWVWKNTNSKYVGLVHYRRFFCGDGRTFSHSGKNVASGEELLERLSRCNFICVQPIAFFHPESTIPCSVEQQYVGCHSLDLIQTRRVIAERHSAYLPAYDFVMRNHYMIPFNMFVTTREIFDAYSEWIFDVLFAVEQYIPWASMEGYQARVPAFLAERLFTVWIGHNRSNLHPDYRPYIFFEDL